MLSYTVDNKSVRTDRDQQRVSQVVNALVNRIAHLEGYVEEWEASMDDSHKRSVVLTPTMPSDANLTGIIFNHDPDDITKNIQVIGVLTYRFKFYIPWLGEYITIMREK